MFARPVISLLAVLASAITGFVFFLWLGRWLPSGWEISTVPLTVFFVLGGAAAALIGMGIAVANRGCASWSNNAVGGV